MVMAYFRAPAEHGMERKLRVEQPKAMEHRMNRGERRKPIIRDEQDRKCFAKAPGEAYLKTSWKAHGYCLTPNPFHVII